MVRQKLSKPEKAEDNGIEDFDEPSESNNLNPMESPKESHFRDNLPSAFIHDFSKKKNGKSESSLPSTSSPFNLSEFPSDLNSTLNSTNTSISSTFDSQPVKRGRGRPRKDPNAQVPIKPSKSEQKPGLKKPKLSVAIEAPTPSPDQKIQDGMKRGRGRPRKSEQALDSFAAITVVTEGQERDDEYRPEKKIEGSKGRMVSGRLAHVGYFKYRGNKEAFDALPKEEQEALIKTSFKATGELYCLNKPKCMLAFRKKEKLLRHLRDCQPLTREDLMKREDTQEAVQRYEDCRGKLAEWNEIDETEQKRILRIGMQEGLALSCLSCGGGYTTSQGLWSHMVNCSKKLARDAAIKSGPQNRTEALEFYEKYRGKIEDWLNLTTKEKRRIIFKFIFEGKPSGEPLKCLNCEKTFISGQGIYLHMQNCTTAKADKELSPCGICGEILMKAGMERHMTYVHPLESLQMDLDGNKGRRKTALASQSIMKEYLTEDQYLEINGYECEKALQDDSSQMDEFLPPFLPTHFPSIPSTSKRKPDGKMDVSGHFRRQPNPLRCLSDFDELFRRFKKHNYSKDGELFSEWKCDEENWKPVVKSSEELNEYFPPLEQSMFFEESGKCGVLQRFGYTVISDGLGAFVGGPIAALEWCSDRPSSSSQLLAVSTFSDSDLGLKTGKDMVQLWKINVNDSSATFVAGILHEFGTVADLSWCPSGITSSGENGRLGALALATASGKIVIYCIPDCILSQETSDKAMYEPEPVEILDFSEDDPCISVDWSPFKEHSQILTCSDTGKVGVVDLIKKDWNILIEPDHERKAVAWIKQNQIVVVFVPSKSIYVFDFEDDQCFLEDFKQVHFFGHGLCSFPEISNNGFLSWNETPSNGTIFVYANVVSKETKNLLSGQNGTKASNQLWSCDVNPWTGEVVSVCNGGTVGISVLNELKKRLSSKSLKPRRSRYYRFKEMGLKPLSEGIEWEECKSYEDTAQSFKATLTLPNVKAMSLNNMSDAFYDAELSSRFPATALFRARWNKNECALRTFAFGGQLGFLFVSTLHT